MRRGERRFAPISRAAHSLADTYALSFHVLALSAANRKAALRESDSAGAIPPDGGRQAVSVI